MKEVLLERCSSSCDQEHEPTGPGECTWAFIKTPDNKGKSTTEEEDKAGANRSNVSDESETGSNVGQLSQKSPGSLRMCSYRNKWEIYKDVEMSIIAY